MLSRGDRQTPPAMNNLPFSKQVEIVSALCEGIGQRAVSRLTDTDRKTVARLALRVGRGCAELHDRMMVGVRTNRPELDELWAFVQRKRRQLQAPGMDAASGAPRPSRQRTSLSGAGFAPS
jgi:hypothetical protein